MITPLPGATPTKPGSGTLPFFGVDAAVVNKEGKELPANVGGYLVIRRPWPSMLRNLYGDPERYKRQYWSEIPHVYFTGDGCRRDEDGFFWMKKLKWDQPVIEVYPTFKLGDADTTKKVLIKHLICACTGLMPSWRQSGPSAAP